MRKLNSQFDKLRSFTETKADAAVHAGALEIRNGASIRAPKLTGTLARSINAERNIVTSTEVVYDIGTDLDYAATQEFGYGGISAQPYLRPALDEDGKIAVETIRRAVEQFLKEF